MTYGVPQTILLGDTSLTITANSSGMSGQSRQTPTNVALYLEREGWVRVGDNWMPQDWDSNITNSLSWEQALIYTGFTKLNLL